MTSSSDADAPALRNRFAPIPRGKPASVWMLQLALPFRAQPMTIALHEV